MRRIDRILVIKGKTQYGQMRYALDEMINGFLNKVCLVTILDLLHDEGGRLRVSVDFVKDYDFIISMNLIGYDLYLNAECDDKPLFWGYLEDHPFHLHQRINLVHGNVLLSCCDKRQVDYTDRFLS